MLWNNFYTGELRRRISIPTYSFDQLKYPVNVDSLKMINAKSTENNAIKIKDINQWFYTPAWKLTPLINTNSDFDKDKCIVLLADPTGIGELLKQPHIL